MSEPAEATRKPVVHSVHGVQLSALVVVEYPLTQAAQVRSALGAPCCTTSSPASHTVHASQASASVSSVNVSPVHAWQLRFTVAEPSLITSSPGLQCVF